MVPLLVGDVIPDLLYLGLAHAEGGVARLPSEGHSRTPVCSLTHFDELAFTFSLRSERGSVGGSTNTDDARHVREDLRPETRLQNRAPPTSAEQRVDHKERVSVGHFYFPGVMSPLWGCARKSLADLVS